MLIGCPKEIKTHEYRVGLVPGSVRELLHHGHPVVIESGAGQGIGFDDQAYRNAGAEVVDSAAEVFRRAEMIVKVKEPQSAEIALLRDGQVLFTYLHLAADPAAWRCRSARIAWRRSRAAPACCWAGCPVCRRPRW
jgi:alanine dehydrogenase